MKPLLTNHIPALTETMPRCCMPIANLLTTREQVGMVVKNKKLNLILTLICYSDCFFLKRHLSSNNRTLDYNDSTILSESSHMNSTVSD